jgi:hydroxyacylglutathione hydrolase
MVTLCSSSKGEYLMLHHTLPVGPLQCNCQILIDPISRNAVLIDPGAEPGKIIAHLEAQEATLGAKIQVMGLLHTHAHFDHFGATRAVKEHFLDAPEIFLHSQDLKLYQALVKQGERFGIPMSEPLPVDRFVLDEEILQFGAIKLQVIHTPGHSPGGVCFHCDGLLFSGDTLFKESVGRTDLWGGDEATLKKSIQDRLFHLDQDTVVYPGHGPTSSVGFERKMNPYVGVGSS